ncbi:hypothetical protein J1N35_010617 [Gossypium stocksii]|uniref:Uncharacterized protein n=1 Tax=Gossypium stocksii TaxID=47602 RepID=A0A9D3W0R4_9ROSI|nr:hypothetical protein J1N35_010617 [Gossypium stocksii]
MIAIAKDEFTSFITFPFGTYLSYIFKHLNIPTQSDPPLATLTPLSFGVQPKIHEDKDEDEDEDAGNTPDSIQSQEQVPPPSFAPPQEQKFSTNTLVILVAILCLNSLHLHHL